MKACALAAVALALLGLAAAQECASGTCSDSQEEEYAAMLQKQAKDTTKVLPPTLGTVNSSCGNCASTGMYDGECEANLVCAPPPVIIPGACSTCQYPGSSQGEKCGYEPDGGYYGTCYPGLICQEPWSNTAGAYSRCIAKCGTFDGEGDSVLGQCAQGTCSCRAPTPCRTWAGECFLYCC